MKIYRISGKTINVANVGSFDSFYDKDRRNRAQSWLSKHDPDYIKENQFNEDSIDLNNGRDFLKESKTYDIVILHHIFNPQYSKNGEGIYLISPLHSKENWAKRLLSSGANYIFVFGDIGKVSGGWLGDISGYNLIRSESGYESVYRNNNLPPITIESDKPIDWDNIDVSWLEPEK